MSPVSFGMNVSLTAQEVRALGGVARARQGWLTAMGRVSVKACVRLRRQGLLHSPVGAEEGLFAATPFGREVLAHVVGHEVQAIQVTLRAAFNPAPLAQLGRVVRAVDNASHCQMLPDWLKHAEGFEDMLAQGLATRTEKYAHLFVPTRLGVAVAALLGL